MARHVPWLLVALCFALTVASRSISDTFAVFVPALQDHFAASRSAVTVVYSFALFAGGTGAPVAGWIVDRFGLRALTVTGMVAASLGTLSAWRATELWHLYLGLGVVLGFGGMCVSAVFSSSLIGRWFPVRRLGVALAVAWSAAGVGAIIMIPLAEHMIVTGGWRHAYLVFAVISACFVPLLLVLPWRPIAAGAPGLLRPQAASIASATAGTSGFAGPTVADALRDWPFWALGASFGLTSLGIFAIAPQAVVYMLEHGLDGAFAARAVAVAGFLTPLGMVGFSWLADRGGRKLAAILAYASSIAGVGMLALVHSPRDELFVWGYVLLFGGSMGSRGPMISTLATLRYRGAHFGKIYGLISIGTGIGGFLGAWIGGLLHDLTGGYGAVMIFASLALASAALTLGAEAGARERLTR
jgi:MFS family permease